MALIELASHYDQGFLQIDQIATVRQMPDRYLAQLLMMLRRSGLVRSQRGAKGGYQLAKPPQQITLLEILGCLEGTNSQEQSQQVPLTLESLLLKEVWREVTKTAMGVFKSYTLQELCDKRNKRLCANAKDYT